jgi:Outer membrane protein beta-barrel domain
MNKLLAVVVVLLIAMVLVSPASAQSKKGENVLTLGLGLGYPGLYGSSGVPPIFATLDHAIQDRISVGGVIGYTSSSYSIAVDKWSYTYIVVGARGAYHFADEIKDLKNVDLYGGITIGYNIVSSSFSGAHAEIYNYSAGGSYFHFGVFVGGRYFFSPKWAATAELGYDIGYIKVGISYKL